jgi:sulfatase modifying factor 1
MKRRPNSSCLLFLLGIAFHFTATVHAITIDLVQVGNPGNAADTRYHGLSVGSVSYKYQIGKYEVTVGQYAAFLNAVGVTDTYALYNPNMATDLNIAGIARAGESGSYTYSVIGSTNHPVTYVSWEDAARFSNWLNNGQPSGAQDASTTEDGAYPLNGATTDLTLSAVSRKANAKWFIPTESEWYKAAYHEPASQGGDSNSYWIYPMRTNSLPYSDQPPGATPNNMRVGNFYQDDGLADGYNDGFAVSGSKSYSSSQNYLTDVGAYASSASYYGTFDQGGNVWEWNEAVYSDVRGIRGGAWNSSTSDLLASYLNGDSAFDEDYRIGFRVASLAVPEPASLTLSVVGVSAIVLRRRKGYYAFSFISFTRSLIAGAFASSDPSIVGPGL